jgi:hypothetical protein
MSGNNTDNISTTATARYNMSSHLSYGRLNRYQEKEENIDKYCNECNSANIMECCNKCGNGVCLNETCGWVFPHYNASTYTICKSCVSIIENKLTVLVDYSKLVLLKKKINKKIEQKIRSLDKTK